MVRIYLQASIKNQYAASKEMRNVKYWSLDIPILVVSGGLFGVLRPQIKWFISEEIPGMVWLTKGLISYTIQKSWKDSRVYGPDSKDHVVMENQYSLNWLTVLTHFEPTFS